MSDWIEAFVENTAHTGSPELFRRWAAISIIAAALERKVWVRTRGAELYPNLYVILVAPPGVGKTLVTSRAGKFIKGLEKHHVAHSSLTKAALIDNLSESARHIVRPTENPAVVNFNSLYVCSNELGVLLPAYDVEFMSTLTDLWDCETYSEKRRTKDRVVEIKKPQLNMLAACQPAYLMNALPEGAWDQGFTSRSIFVYSGEATFVGLFEEMPDNTEGTKELLDELKIIGELYGQMNFTDEAKAMISAWHKNGCQPVPDHPRLASYNVRRIAHALKVIMCICAAQGGGLTITVDHVQSAIDNLVEAELYMPEIFKAMGSTSHAKIIEETWHFIFKNYNKDNKRPVAASRILNFISQRVPAHNVQRVLEVMEQANMLQRVLESYGTAYRPLGKQD